MMWVFLLFFIIFNSGIKTKEYNIFDCYFFFKLMSKKNFSQSQKLEIVLQGPSYHVVVSVSLYKS